MKRRLRICTVLLSVTLGTALGACGSSDPEEARTAGGDTTGEPAFPVTVTNALGTVTVPERPERVVAIGLSELDTLLALGVVPVAFGTYGGDLFDYEVAALDGADAPEAFSLADGIPMEKIAGYAPDLIVNMSWGTESDYRKLNKIAPVVSYVAGNFADPWQTQVAQVAPAVGAAEEGEAQVVAAESSLAAADGLDTIAGKTVTYATTAEDGVCVVDLPTSPALDLFARLGLEPHPDFLDPKSLYCREVSTENLDEIESDLLVMVATPGEQADLEADRLFAGLDVVAEGRTVWLDADDGLANVVNSPTLLGIPYLIDDLVPQLVDTQA